MANTNPRTGGRAPAKKRPAPQRRRAMEKLGVAPKLPLERENWMVIGAGLVVIVAGFIALAHGSITLAPFLLVTGYCVLIPVGILLPRRRRSSGEDAIARTGVGE